MDLVNDRAKIEAFRKRAEELVSKMTLEEKVSQTLNHAPAIERLGIKAYDWWNEALHGVARAGTATVFPQAIGLAAAFDEDLMEELGDVVSTEGRAKFNIQQKFSDTDIYKGLTFWAPNVNIFRDPRWGRGQETYGEDPYLTSRLGVRYIKGLQGHDEDHLKAAACAKHFAVHSGPEPERHHFNAIASKQDMRETYLPAFKAAVQEAHVETVMGAYNRTNGEPCCGSKTLLRDILRDEYGFKGHVVSDCWAIKDFHTGHMVTSDEVESVSLAMNNGCDLNCGDLFVYLNDAVEQGMVREERLDEALVNLFTTRMKLGMFDGEKTAFDNITMAEVDSKAHRKLNLDTSAKTLVLLKNDGILPLDKSKIRTVGVIGPNADSRRALVGNYEGTASRYVTVLEGLEDYLGDDVDFRYSEGCHLVKDRLSGLSTGDDRISEVKSVCEDSDVIFVALGLDAGVEGEEGDAGNEFASGDKIDLKLPGLQQEVLDVAISSGKPVILLLLVGSALAVDDSGINAVIQCWYPGAMGGRAIAETVFGDRNFEGKLPVTFYRTTAELPDFTDYAMKGRTYRYMTGEALYPFGYGLSYTSFEYSNVKADKTVADDDGITIDMDVTNKGNVDGRETVQVYVKVNGVENAPNYQLKGFKKVAVKAGETEHVSITLSKDSFGLFDTDGKFVIPSGKAIVYVGGQQPDARSEQLLGRKVTQMEITIP
ncbi:MAG: glycoside hydrolase family 3 C-terminal domain-containing protein [Lachnospiraceae bacterium]|nr:glycoside hydrolase family 3 C-terminal domain-containing protein [Lachnospiraceae bacterium]